MLVHIELMNKFKLPGGYADIPTSVAGTKSKEEGSLLPPPQAPWL